MNDFSESISEMTDLANEVNIEFEETAKANAEYRAELEACIFDTRDMLAQWRIDSVREHRWMLVATFASIIAAIGTIVSVIILFMSFIK